jgi:hypothetical protein
MSDNARRIESALAQQLRRERVEAIRCLTHTQRLEVFLAHSRLMMKLFEAGRQLRLEGGQRPPSRQV